MVDLVAILQTSGFNLDFCSLLYRSLIRVLQMNVKRLYAFALSVSVRQGCPLSPLPYDLSLELLLCRLRDNVCRSGPCGIGVIDRARARFSAYTDDIYIFMSFAPWK